jgi:hypothetical protein
MQAKVVKAFTGVKDGDVHPVRFNPDDVVEGKLAVVAVEQGWATAEPKPVRPPQKLV